MAVAASEKKSDHIYLIDGSGYIFRAYHALPPLTRPDGIMVNAVYGFCTMLQKLLRDVIEGDQPTHLAVIFDAGRLTFRNDIYPEYKAHRPPAPDDLIPQFALIREATQAFSVPAIELAGYEADDIIATYARQAREKGWTVTIVSSDKDLMQLVTPEVNLLDTMKDRRIGIPQVMEKFGVGPDKVIEVQALMGDAADNVPGVPGIGPKGAAELINQYGSLENLLAHAEEIKQPKRRQNLIDFADIARVCLKLLKLKDDVPDLDPIDELTVKNIDPEPLMAFLEAQNFKSLAAKIRAALAHDGGQADQAVAEIKPQEIKYETVSDAGALKRWIAAAHDKGIVAVDTETTSLNAMRAELVGVSLSVEAGQACYIPLGHSSHKGGELDFGGGNDIVIPQMALKEALQLLKPLLADPAVLKVGQNIKYDMLVLKKYGIDIHPFDDTMLISYALDAGQHGHGMDELSELHLGHKTISFAEVAGSGRNQVTFDQVAIDKATAYAAEDADITGRLYRTLKPRLAREGLTTVYETLERPLAPVLVEMENWGIKVDAKVLARLSSEFASRIAELEQDIYKLAGREFNVGSPKQLGEILFDEMGHTGGKKGKSGNQSTGVDVLEALAAEGHDLPARVLDWRQLSKLKSTYTDALQQQVNDKTGRIHTSYSMASTTTGRLSSNDPNLQNIPIRSEEGRKIRQAFIPEPGFQLISADYSQIELRLLAHIAGIDSLREAFAEGLDIHAMTASQVFDVPIEGMDPGIRRKAKAINFGIIYGISPFGLARQIGVSQSEAKKYIENYFARFPGIQRYMEETKEFCRQNGYVTTIFGRRCHIPLVRDKDGARRAFGERAAINAPIQGAAADIIRRAMIRMPEALASAHLKARMLLQVHDELVFEVPETEIEETIHTVKNIMEKAHLPAVDISVPLTVECGRGGNWDEAH
jgi:DNA polymerase-1